MNEITSEMNRALVALPVYSNPKTDPPVFTNLHRALRVYLKEEISAERKIRIYYRDDDFVVIYDAFPKAKAHLLLIPRPSTLLGEVQEMCGLNGKHKSELERFHRFAHRVKMEVEKEKGVVMKMGYHIIPSLTPLHLHIVSEEFESTCLKTKKHWNSFNSDFFVETEKVMSNLEGEEFNKLKATAKALLKQDLKCNKCAKPMQNMPGLKKHLVECHQTST